MQSANLYYIFRCIPFFSMLGLLLLNAGCAPTTQSSLQHRTQATIIPPGQTTLPTYVVGTTFVYSDGTWERVAESNPSYIIWENDRGESFLNSPDFTYRPSRWENKNIRGYRTFAPTEYLYSSTQTSLWPLAVGNRIHFDEKNKWGIPGVYERHNEFTWKCSVDGTERVRVPAGTFDTWKITCSRYSKITRAQRATLWEDKTFHYSPSIGHWVSQEQDFQGSRAKVRKELVAILPSLSALGIEPAAAIGIKEHFQQTLGSTSSGEMSRWTDDKKKISFTMTPIATFRTVDGTPCRQYEQRLDLGWQAKFYYGIACRGESGLWAVPRR